MECGPEIVIEQCENRGEGSDFGLDFEEGCSDFNSKENERRVVKRQLGEQ